jgi:hypothetical protein
MARVCWRLREGGLGEGGGGPVGKGKSRRNEIENGGLVKQEMEKGG